MNYPYVTEFRQSLVEWFNAEKRDLPWRHTSDPYKIWVSEVMLQQTRLSLITIVLWKAFQQSNCLQKPLKSIY